VEDKLDQILEIQNKLLTEVAEIKQYMLTNLSKKRKPPKPASPEIKEWFEAAWLEYPKVRRHGKKECLRHYCATVKCNEDKLDFLRALHNYKKSLNGKGQFTKAASGWFNQWRDWLNYKAPVEPGSAVGAAYDNRDLIPRTEEEEEEFKRKIIPGYK